MEPKTKEEAERWCKEQGAHLGADGFPEPAEAVVEFRIPSDAGQRVALVGHDLERFRGCAETLVWFDDWSVWPSGQRMHVFERFLASYGERRPLCECPAFLFPAAEHDDLASFVTIGVLFLWDVHVIGSRAERLLCYSHDEYGWTTEQEQS